MKKRHHSKLIKSGAAANKKSKETYVLDIYIDMLFREAILKYEKEKLTKQIDRAIDEGDRQTFHTLAQKFIDLNKRFGL